MAYKRQQKVAATGTTGIASAQSYPFLFGAGPAVHGATVKQVDARDRACVCCWYTVKQNVSVSLTEITCILMACMIGVRGSNCSCCSSWAALSFGDGCDPAADAVSAGVDGCG